MRKLLKRKSIFLLFCLRYNDKKEQNWTSKMRYQYTLPHMYTDITNKGYLYIYMCTGM